MVKIMIKRDNSAFEGEQKYYEMAGILRVAIKKNRVWTDEFFIIRY